MRKAIIQLKPNMLVRKIQKGIYDSLLRIEGRELLKLDFERTTKMVIADLILKPGRHLEDVDFPSGVDILNVFKVEGERYTVLMRAKAPGKKFTGLFKMFDLNVIYDVPFSATSELIIFSAMGENEPLNKLIKLLKLLGEVEKVSFTRSVWL